MSSVRGKPFLVGNKHGQGRPAGIRNKATLLAQQLLEEHAEPIMRKCIVEALKGEKIALRLCVERIQPAARDRSINMSRLAIRTTEDLDKASQRIIQEITKGQITPTEGETILNILEGRRRILESAELDRRVKALEQISIDDRRAA